MRKIVLWSVAGILILGLGVALFLRSRQPQVIVLENGGQMTLLGTEYGKHHEFPRVGERNAGPQSFDTTNDTLVAWVLEQQKRNQTIDCGALVYDRAETGCV